MTRGYLEGPPVLIVDDAPATRAILRDVLFEMGTSVLCVRDLRASPRSNRKAPLHKGGPHSQQCLSMLRCPRLGLLRRLATESDEIILCRSHEIQETGS